MLLLRWTTVMKLLKNLAGEFLFVLVLFTTQCDAHTRPPRRAFWSSRCKSRGNRRDCFSSCHSEIRPRLLLTHTALGGSLGGTEWTRPRFIYSSRGEDLTSLLTSFIFGEEVVWSTAHVGLKVTLTGPAVEELGRCRASAAFWGVTILLKYREVVERLWKRKRGVEHERRFARGSSVVALVFVS